MKSRTPECSSKEKELGDGRLAGVCKPVSVEWTEG